MPVRMEVTLLNAGPLRGWLSRAPGEFQGALFAATSKAVEVTARSIREDTPQRTGKMKGSIGTRVRSTADGVVGEVYNTDQATRFVEFGTRQHGRAQRMFARGIAQTRPSVKSDYQSAIGRVTGTF